MELITIKLDDYKPHPQNPTPHPDHQLDELDDSLGQFGQFKNVVVWNDYYLADHGLVEAARRKGLKTLEAVDVSHLSEEKAKSLMIADNRLPVLGVMDDELLTNLLKEFDDALTIPGVDLDFIKNFDFGEDSGGDEDLGPLIDRAAELVEEYGVKVGQLWQLGDHRLVCGDCTDKAVVERLMGKGKKAACVFTDPPYGMGLDTDFSNMKGFGKGKKYKKVEGDFKDYNPAHIFEIFGYCKEIFLWGADYYAEEIPNRNKGSWMVWDKTGGGVSCNSSYNKMYGSNFELCWSKQRHKRAIVPCLWKGVFGLNKEPDKLKKRFHAAQKPVELAIWILEKFTNKGHAIVDLYCGAGFVVLACEKLDRKCHTIEINPGYVAVTIHRWEEFTGRKAKLIK